MKRIMLFLLAALVVVGLVSFDAEAALTTKSASGYTTANGITVTYFTHTFVTRKDTIACTMVIGGKGVNPAVPFVIYVGVARGAADSIPSLNVRYEYSPDGVNWQSSTIGTDSTTWFTTNVYSKTASFRDYPYTVTTYPINGTNGIVGFHPYNRVVIMGRTANTVGTRVKVWYGVQ